MNPDLFLVGEPEARGMIFDNLGAVSDDVTLRAWVG